MVFGISPTVKMRTMGTSKACLRKNYLFLRLAGVTMIMDISKGQTLTTAGQSGSQSWKLNLFLHLYISNYSGPDPNKPCVFPFNYYGAKNEKCLESRFDVDGPVDVSEHIFTKKENKNLCSPGVQQNSIKMERLITIAPSGGTVVLDVQLRLMPGMTTTTPLLWNITTMRLGGSRPSWPTSLWYLPFLWWGCSSVWSSLSLVNWLLKTAWTNQK